MSGVTPDLVVIGNLLVDDIVRSDGRTHMGLAGGAALHLSLAARLWGTEVGIASVAGSDYPVAALDELAARGVRLEGVRHLDRPGVRTWLLYEERVRRVLHRRGSPTHEEVSPGPADLPAAWLGARAFHLAPMPLECQRALVRALAARPGAFLSLDPHQPVTEDSLPRWRPLLDALDAFFVSEDELRLEGVTRDPRAALRRLAGGRLRFVAFKRGADGGLLFDVAAGAFVEWPPVPGPIVEPTGAGDAFAGGFLAGVIAGVPLEEALARAAVATTFVLADVGAAGLLAATAEAARARLAGRDPVPRGSVARS